MIRFVRVPVFAGIPPIDWARAAETLIVWGYLRRDQLTEDLHDLLQVCASEQHALESAEEAARKAERDAARKQR